MTSYRLPQGGGVDRGRSIDFTFDGEALRGLAGDSLASALLANDRALMGRSFKYHRPRGVMTAGAAEPNALVTLGRGGRREANARATMVELFNGLEAVSQNRWPSLGFDVGAVNGLFGPLLGAGFYYKTFMWPAAFWERVYEPLIRRAAGLGRASYAPDPDAYDKRWAHCDLLVIGAGATGLAAALTAARAGARVILADENPDVGGQLLSEAAQIDGRPAADFVAAARAELESLDNATVLARTTVFGWYDSGAFGALERVSKHRAPPAAPAASAAPAAPAAPKDPQDAAPVERLWRIIAKQAVLASGAEERPIAFGGNDRPGVMLAGAMRTYARRYGVAVGRRVAIFTNGAHGYRVAEDLEAAGVNVVAIVDPAARADSAYAGAAEVLTNARVLDAHGGRRLRGATVAIGGAKAGGGANAGGGARRRLDVDALGVFGGFSPVVHLACQRGDRPQWSDAHGAFLPPPARDGLTAAGAAAGRGALSECLADGAAAAAAALERLGRSATATQFAVDAPTAGASAAPAAPAAPATPSASAAPCGASRGRRERRSSTFRTTFTSPTSTSPRARAMAMSNSPSATPPPAWRRIRASCPTSTRSGCSPAPAGSTRRRWGRRPTAPFIRRCPLARSPAPIAGGIFSRCAARRSMIGPRDGATFIETGLWMRSQWFPKPGETHWRQSVDREVDTVRNAVGLCDVSTLGKIEIVGADAAEFLNRVYCNAFLKLPVGKARYGIMLREDGHVYDDGTTSRLGEHQYFMTTTTALAAGVLTHLEFCAQALWPELDVRFASATDQWAQMAVAGPKARATLQPIVDEDLSNEAFPFLAAREVSLFGGRLRGRLYRISFSGELAFELGVPADYGEAVADALLESGRAHGIAPYGSEALGVLRIEKGHVTHSEINGTVTPADLGLGGMVSKKKPDFIGRAMLRREGLNAPDRPRLVGVKPLDPADTFRAGAHILRPGDAPSLDNDQGYVTSYCHSPTLGHAIALALVTRGPERHGEEVVIWDALKGAPVRGALCSPVFVDPENEKLHV